MIFRRRLSSPTLLDGAGIEQAAQRVRPGRRHPQYGATEGARRCASAGAALRRARYRGEARGHPGDHGLATGFRPAGARVRGTRRRGLCGIALLSGDAAGAAGRRAHRAGAGGRPGHADRCAGNAAGERAGRCLPKLIYTVPTYSNPCGTLLSQERRAQLASLAARHGVVVVEDDPYGELRFRPRRSSRSTRWARGCRRPIR